MIPSGDEYPKGAHYPESTDSSDGGDLRVDNFLVKLYVCYNERCGTVRVFGLGWLK